MSVRYLNKICIILPGSLGRQRGAIGIPLGLDAGNSAEIPAELQIELGLIVQQDLYLERVAYMSSGITAFRRRVTKST